MKYGNFLFIFILMMLLAITAVSADSDADNQIWVSVDGTGSGESIDNPTDMMTALNNVKPNFTVNFLDGTYSPNTYQINQRNITLKALNPGGVIFTGNNANEMFRVAGVGIVLDGFVFRDGSINAYGGAIFWGGSEGILRNCVFEDNYAFSGGAVYWQGSDALVDNCTFIGNKAGGAGAVHWAGPNSIMRNCLFEDNVAEVSDGGAIHWSSANGVIENCQFINNNALEHIGGAIYWSGVNGLFANNTFRNNRDKLGYQFYNDQSATFKNNTFNTNRAIYNNGVINGNLNVVVLGNETKQAEINKDYTLSAIITDDNGNRIGGENLTFVVGGEDIQATADSNAVYSSVYEIRKNATIVSAKYPYGTNVTVYGATIVTDLLKGDDVVMYYKNGTRYVVYTAAATGNVKITINDISYSCSINNKSASLPLNLNPGNYTVTAQYGNCTITNNVKILPTVDTAELIKFFKNDSQFVVRALDNHGNALPDYDLSFNINGVFYSRTTNQSGFAIFNINLPPGNYVITTMGLNDCLVSNNVTVLPTLVDNKNMVMFFKNGSRYAVRALDGNGNPSNGTAVTFNINGVFYNVTTNSEGIASLAINLRPGTYIITAIYNGFMVSNSIQVLSTIDTDDLDMNYGSGMSFFATVYGAHGQLLEGAKVVFNINGRLYDRTTDANGFTYLDINLAPGEYIITTYCNDLAVSNTIRVFKNQ